MMMKVTDGVKGAVLMVIVQVVYTGLNILYKLVANDGMSFSVFTAYRFIFALIFILPLAIFFERESLKELNRKVLLHAFLCGIFGGSLHQNLYIRSVAWASATYVTAMFNLIPAVTFILAISLGLEKMNLGTASGKAKVIGTLTGVSGAMILTLYKGRKIYLWSTNIDLIHHVATSHGATSFSIWGYFLGFGSCLCYSTWLIIQTRMLKEFPWHYMSVALMSIMGSLQSVIYAFCTERDWSQWKLTWDIRLISIVYTGILASGVNFTLISWCAHRKGPVFVSIFSPLVLVLVAIAGSLFLEETLTVGSVIGGVLIICGLYMVLWGKGKEAQQMTPPTVLPLHDHHNNNSDHHSISKIQQEEPKKKNMYTHARRINYPVSINNNYREIHVIN